MFPYICSVMCPGYFCGVRVESWLGRVEYESCHKNCRVIGLQARVIWNFTFFYDIFYTMKWRPTCYKMAPSKLENGAQCCFNKFDCRLFISKFSHFEFYLSFSLSVVIRNLGQTYCKCCNFSVSDALNVQFTMNRMTNTMKRMNFFATFSSVLGLQLSVQFWDYRFL